MRTNGPQLLKVHGRASKCLVTSFPCSMPLISKRGAAHQRASDEMGRVKPGGNEPHSPISPVQQPDSQRRSEQKRKAEYYKDP